MQERTLYVAETDGITPIDDARKDLCIAKGVMIHIGGWYYNQGENKNKLAGSYGRFGFIPGHQVFGNKNKAQEILEQQLYLKWETSNNGYKSFLKKVSSVGESSKNKIHVVIEKRSDVENFKDEEYKSI